MVYKKNLTRVLAVLLSISLLAGCTSTGTETKPTTETPVPPEVASEEETAATETAEKIDLAWRPYDENGEIKRDDRDANGTKGVVSTGKYEASKIGADIIEQGGNAIDAAVAVGFALGVCEPQSSGIGGGGFMMIHSAKTGETKFIDFREIAPANATPAMWELDEEGEVKNSEKFLGGKSVGVPGEVKGLLYALDTYGTMTRDQVMNPAIQMAEDGFEVSAVLNRDMMGEYQVLTDYEEVGKIYLKDDLPYEVGDVLKNPQLAATLSQIREEGESAFYTGPMAEAIAKAVVDSGGVMTVADLANYNIVEREPATSTYRGYEIISAPPPSSGGTTVVEILNILENYDIGAMDMNSAEYYHILSEAFKISFADRAAFVGDPDFVDIPFEGITSKSYAAERAALIDPVKSGSYTEGDPKAHESEDTTHYSIMDSEGNIVAVTKTINYVFGSGVSPEGTGFILNDEMDDFDAGTEGVNIVEPGKKPLSSMSPTIVMKDGKPFMAIGAPGSQRIITGVVQVITKVIDHNMDIQEAISAPRLHDGSDWTTDGETIIYESRISPEVAQELKDMGHLMVEDEEWMEYPCVQAVVMLEDGTLRGGADPRRDGKALGF